MSFLKYPPHLQRQLIKELGLQHVTKSANKRRSKDIKN
ncbi:hypothetical protein SynPROS71_00088 [Synechococcus sp. PROS-7-1]|nr:hypothetical protein SynPROS71_00088 [Synechococcus sp. PROS-7-1]